MLVTVKYVSDSDIYACTVTDSEIYEMVKNICDSDSDR